MVPSHHANRLTTAGRKNQKSRWREESYTQRIKSSSVGLTWSGAAERGRLDEASCCGLTTAWKSAATHSCKPTGAATYIACFLCCYRVDTDHPSIDESSMQILVPFYCSAVRHPTLCLFGFTFRVPPHLATRKRSHLLWCMLAPVLYSTSNFSTG